MPDPVRAPGANFRYNDGSFPDQARGADSRRKGGGSLGTTFAATSREFTLRYAGLSFYWAWVFLGLNPA